MWEPPAHAQHHVSGGPDDHLYLLHATIGSLCDANQSQPAWARVSTCSNDKQTLL